MTKQFANILHHIVENIRTKDLQYYDIGLLTGKSGIALFLFYYSKHVKDNIYAKEALDLIVDVFNSIKEGYNFPTFCDGVAGFAWTVEHLVQHGFIVREDVPFLDDLDQVLYKQMMQQIKNGNYDFLHGAIGIGIYFLNRSHNKACIDYMTEFLDELEKQSTEDKDGLINWESTSDDEPGVIGCNLGLSHGMASIIVLLSKAFMQESNKTKTLRLLNGSVNYLLSQRLDINESGSNFPNWVFDNNRVTIDRKMGWCYGDMGRSFAIYQASKATGNIEWKNIALNVLLDTTYLKDMKSNNVIDPSLCHGTTGIAHMYNRMYNETKMNPFKEAASYWFKETFKLTKFKNDIVDFKDWFPNESNSKREYGILTGAAGIGLVLISAISNKEQKWDRCLLLP